MSGGECFVRKENGSVGVSRRKSDIPAEGTFTAKAGFSAAEVFYLSLSARIRFYPRPECLFRENEIQQCLSVHFGKAETRG